MKTLVGVEALAGDTPRLTGEFVGETHRVLECTQYHPPRKQHQKGPLCLWVVGKVTESGQGAEQAPLLPLGPSPTYSITAQLPALPCPGEHLKLHPLLCNRPAQTRKVAQMKEQIKAPEKIQLSNKEIANLSDAYFKTLVIRKLTELVEFGCKLDEKMKAMLRETKENVQGTNSEAKETGTHINGVDQKEERNIQPEKNEETRTQNNEEWLRNLQDILKRSNI